MIFTGSYTKDEPKFDQLYINNYFYANYRIFRCISRPYLLELKVEIQLIFGVQPYFEILIRVLKQSSVQKKFVPIEGHNSIQVKSKSLKFNSLHAFEIKVFQQTL